MAQACTLLPTLISPYPLFRSHLAICSADDLIGLPQPDSACTAVQVHAPIDREPSPRAEGSLPSPVTMLRSRMMLTNLTRIPGSHEPKREQARETSALPASADVRPGCNMEGVWGKRFTSWAI
jgi:hypothetical protein